MTHDGGGGGGSGTYWYGVNIEDMWRWVNRDLTPHYQQATSWKKTSELTGLYYQRLQAFRDKLAVAWNPRTSPAAEAYLTKLDELIKAVKDVDEVSGRNYQAAVDIPNAIFEAKMKLEPIYRAYKQAQSDYSRSTTTTTTTTTTPTTTPTPTPTPTPRPSPSPSGANAAQTMNTRFDEAVGVMYKLSGDLSRAQTGIGKPAPYTPPQSHLDDGSDYSGGGGSPPPPFIPAVVPSPPPPPPPGPTSPMPAPKGPDLSGLQPAPPAPTGPGMPPPMTPGPGGPTPTGPTGPMPSGYPPGGLIQPPAPPGGRPAGQLGTRPISTGMPGGIIGQAPANRSGAAGARPNPVGGMIGGATSAGGRGAAGVTAGGVVGGRPGAAGPGARGNTGRGMIGAGIVGGRPGQHDEEEGEHYDPDTLWDVAQGVAPVLDTPQSQGRIDPGPAIGLSR